MVVQNGYIILIHNILNMSVLNFANTPVMNKFCYNLKVLNVSSYTGARLCIFTSITKGSCKNLFTVVKVEFTTELISEKLVAYFSIQIT